MMTLEQIKANKAQAIELKKSVIKHADSFYTPKISASKGIKSDENADVIQRTVIGNTYNWLDSHNDVHVKNCFAKSISERGDKVFHLHDHEFKLTSKVGTPTKIYEQDIAWKLLGIDKDGMTQALFMDTDIKKSFNPLIFAEYKDGNINQHSVGMYYVKIELAINDEEEKEEFAVWNKYLETLGNKEEAEKLGYFWVVKEAKLIEISAVLLGSNSLTPTIEAEKSLQDKNDESDNALKLNSFINFLKS